MRLASLLAALALLATAVPSAAQTADAYTLRGRVLDARQGSGLPGATVFLQNTTSGAATGIDGSFSFRAPVPAGAYTVRVSFIGYATVTRPVTLGADRTVDLGTISLSEDALRADEVVVTGSGLPTERRQLGNAIGTVTAREIQDLGGTAADQLLAGKIPGVVVQQNSGNPAAGISLRLRGPGTVLGSADPLYIIDGVIVDNSSPILLDLGGGAQNRLVDLNPQDIERFEVVKGAAAAALYGSRANNGVVQIFTRRGASGAPRVTLSSSVRTDAIRKTLPVNQAAFNRPEGDPTRVAVDRFDHQDDIFRRALGTEQYLSVQGGQDGTSYFVSGGHLGNEGIVNGSAFRRLNGRLRVDQRFSQAVKMSVGASYANSRSDDVPNGGLNSAYGALTGFIFGPNTTNIQPDPVTGIYPDIVQTNPLEIVNRFDFNQVTNRFTGDAQLNLTPLAGLAVDYTFGLDTYEQSATAYIPPGTTNNEFPAGWSRRADFGVTSLNHDLRARYQADLGGVASTTLAGVTSEVTSVNTFAVSTRDLPIGIETISGGARPDAPGESRSEVIVLGAFAQQTFGLGDRLFLTAAGRVDGSSAFGPDNRWNVYPKVSASYGLSDESFYQNSPLAAALQTVRLRASYGQTGGITSIGAYDRFTNYAPTSYDGDTGFLRPTRLGATDIKPERQTELEFGVDLGLLNGRLGLEATYYNQNTADLLLNTELALTTGFSNQLRNIGALENKGFELLVRAIPVSTSSLRWTTTATYAANRNRIDLNPNAENDPSAVLILGDSFGLVAVLDDQPLGTFYGSQFYRNAEGRILGQAVAANGTPAVNTDGTPVFVPATLGENNILRDDNGNVVYAVRLGTPGIIGDPNPDWTGSLINEFEIGSQFAFRFQLDASIGGDIFNFTRRLASLPNFGTLDDYQREIEGEVPAGYYGNVAIANTDGLRRGTFSLFENWIEDGSFVKLREVSMSYRVPARLLGGIGVNALRVTAYGRNLLSFDNYYGYDPETNVGGQRTGVRGYDFVEVPIPRTFGLALSATL